MIFVETFLNYAKTGFYNETIFHRVIKGFMVQGGGFDSDMKYKATNDPIQNEASNGLSNERGSIAMARTSAPHSASSQFFINLVDNDFLDHRDKSGQGWGYAVFGKVTNGLDIVDDIANVETFLRKCRSCVVKIKLPLKLTSLFSNHSIVSISR